MDYCFSCGGMGLLGGEPCPECGKRRSVESLLDTPELATKMQRNADWFGVPPQYQGVLWSRSYFEETHKQLLGEKYNIEGGKNDDLFIRFCDNLERIDADFEANGSALKSVGIVAPAGMSKLTFAYSCMQKALLKKKTIAPLLDTIELKRFLMMACENPTYKLYNCVTFDEYVTADVCFVTVTKLPARSWAYQVIQDLIDRRARQGLTTIFISRFAMTSITQQDEADQFRLYAKRKDDVIKCPTMIQYLKGVSH